MLDGNVTCASLRDLCWTTDRPKEVLCIALLIKNQKSCLGSRECGEGSVSWAWMIVVGGVRWAKVGPW